MKKKITDSLTPSEAKDFSSIFDKFSLLARIIPTEHETFYSDLKNDTFKFILCLKSKIIHPIKPMHPYIGDSFLVDSSGRCVETQVNLSDSIKGIEDKSFGRFIPEKTSLTLPCDLSNSRKASAKVQRSHIGTPRDSIVYGDSIEIEKLRTKSLIKTCRAFLKNMINICSEQTHCRCKSKGFSTSQDSKDQMIQQICEDFKKSLKDLSNENNQYFTEENRLREELENCKKVALMYEKRFKAKSEALLAMKKQQKLEEAKFERAKDEVCEFVQWQLKATEELEARFSGKAEKISEKLERIEELIKMRLNLGLEEIKKAVEMTSKGVMFDEHIEMYKKNIEELEGIVRESYEKIQSLEKENVRYCGQIISIENQLRKLQRDSVENKGFSAEYSIMADENSQIKKALKMKEFELKQLNFENSELNTDKNELLSKIESLEIEIIEARENLNDMSIKCNQDIENLLYTNTLQKNQILKLEEEKHVHSEEIQRLETKLIESENLHSTQTVSFNTLTKSLRETIETLQAERESLTSKHQLSLRTASERLSKIESLESELTELKALKSDSESFQQSLLEWSGFIENTSRNISNFSDKLKDINKELRKDFKTAVEEKQQVYPCKPSLTELEETTKQLIFRDPANHQESFERVGGYNKEETLERRVNAKLPVEFNELQGIYEQTRQKMLDCQCLLSDSSRLVGFYKEKFERLSEDFDRLQALSESSPKGVEKSENSFTEQVLL